MDLDDLHGRVVPWSVLAGEPREPAPDQVPPDLDVLETKKPRNLQAERLWKDVLQAEDVRQEIWLPPRWGCAACTLAT